MPKVGRKMAIASLWGALQYQAKKLFSRDELRAGASTPVDLRIVGIVGGQVVDETVAGSLTVGHETEKASNTAVPTTAIVAYLLEQLPATRREWLLENLPSIFQAAGKLELGDDSYRETADLLLKQLRAKSTKTSRGAVRFEPRK